MSTFGNKLKQLRIEKGLTQKESCKIFGVAESTISHYESDKRNPDHEFLIKCAQHYHVSIDWMLGLTDKRNAIVSKEVDPPEKYKKILSMLGVTDLFIFEEAELTDEDWKELIQFAKKMKGTP